jgi:hypothetical protein
MQRTSLGNYDEMHAYHFARAAFRSTLESTRSLDTFSTWILGATSAAAVFLFPASEKAKSVLRPGAGWILSLLVVCVALGLIQKFYAARVSAFLKADRQLVMQVTEAMNSLLIRARYEAKLAIPLDINLIDLQLTPDQVRNIDELIIKLRDQAQKEYKDSVPSSFRKKAEGHIDKYKKDALYLLKKANKDFYWQLGALTLQIGVLFLALLSVLYKIRY